MKPGNLLIQGAKSGVRRKMRVRIAKRSESSERLFFATSVLHPELLERNWREQKGIGLWKKDFLLQNA